MSVTAEWPNYKKQNHFETPKALKCLYKATNSHLSNRLSGLLTFHISGQKHSAPFL